MRPKVNRQWDVSAVCCFLFHSYCCVWTNVCVSVRLCMVYACATLSARCLSLSLSLTLHTFGNSCHFSVSTVSTIQSHLFNFSSLPYSMYFFYSYLNLAWHYRWEKEGLSLSSWAPIRAPDTWKFSNAHCTLVYPSEKKVKIKWQYVYVVHVCVYKTTIHDNNRCWRILYIVIAIIISFAFVALDGFERGAFSSRFSFMISVLNGFSSL